VCYPIIDGTANLVDLMLSVDRKWVHPLPMDIPTEIPDTGGIRVTLIEANHCLCLYLFTLFPTTTNLSEQVQALVYSCLKGIKR
jgi:DNA cross-link repair 1A protein